MEGKTFLKIVEYIIQTKNKYLLWGLCRKCTVSCAQNLLENIRPTEERKETMESFFYIDIITQPFFLSLKVNCTLSFRLKGINRQHVLCRFLLNMLTTTRHAARAAGLRIGTLSARVVAGGRLGCGAAGAAAAPRCCSEAAQRVLHARLISPSVARAASPLRATFAFGRVAAAGQGAAASLAPAKAEGFETLGLNDELLSAVRRTPPCVPTIFHYLYGPTL